MSKIKVYPWTNVAPDYFGKGNTGSYNDPSAAETKMSSDLCEALLCGEVLARDVEGNPASAGLSPDSVLSLAGDYRYVHPDDVNVWLGGYGYLKKWTPSTDPDEIWKDLAREEASDIWLRELNACKKPTKQAVAKEIERRFHRKRVVTTKGKTLTGEYILRHALRGWIPPKPD